MKKFTLILLGGQILIISLFWRTLPPQIPLFYSRPWGKEQLASPSGLIILPLLSLVVFSINSILSSFIFKEEKFISMLLTLTSGVFGLLCFLTLIKIVILIT